MTANASPEFHPAPASGACIGYVHRRFHRDRPHCAPSKAAAAAQHPSLIHLARQFARSTRAQSSFRASWRAVRHPAFRERAAQDFFIRL
jgi:hypothetical protein